MTWLKVDDKITTHPKWVTLTLQAKSLWFHAAVWCAAHNNDGALPPPAMPLIAFTASVQPHELDEAADRLVRARLWRRTPKGKGGGFEIVDWLEYQPSKQQVKDRAEKDEAKRERERLHAWLHKKAVGKKVKGRIDRRDGMHCRYCGELTKLTPGDRRSPHRRTYDLLDPDSRWNTDAQAMTDDEMDAIADLWVVACGWCNAIKQHRTAAEAGMELLPVSPGGRGRKFLPRSAANRSGTVPVLGTGLVGSDLVGSSLAASGGACTVGFGSVLDVCEPPPPPPHDDRHFPGDLP